MAGEELDRGHVDLVKIGPFFTINLDTDKIFVEERCDKGVFKTFSLHDMAPMASGIPNAQKDGFVTGLGLGKGLLAPRKPIHRIVGVK